MSESTTLPAAVAASARSLLDSFTALSSPSGDLEGVRRFAGALAEEFARRALPAVVETRQGKPLLLAGRRDGARPLLLLSHLDTVLAAASPEWRGERLHATGSIDTKAGLVALLSALDLLAAAGESPAPDLLLAAVPDEEISGPVSHAVTRELGAIARAIWVLEPGEPRGEGADGTRAETIVAGRRGMVGFRLRVVGRSAHSGLHYWQGRSALDAAARFAVGARALSTQGVGATVNPARMVSGDRSFVEALADKAAMLGTGQQTNVIPDSARVDGEARFLTPPEAASLRLRLQQLVAETATATGTEMVLEFDDGVPPVDPMGPQRPWCERAVSLAAARGWRLEIEDDRGGISFPNFLADPGRVPVLDGLAPVGGGMHTREEFLDWRSFERRTWLLFDLLRADLAG
jgi:glutamate carboxypeptidase